jgi:predicted PurR-regulated permease PerM
MGPGGIATIIAASSLAIIAVAVAYTVVRASRLIDEITKTVSMINSPIKSISNAGKSLEELLKKISRAGDSFLDENPMAMKAAGAIFTAAKLKKKGKKKSKAKE